VSIAVRNLLVLALLCCALLPASALGKHEKPATLAGNRIEITMPAADFTLIDQRGAPFHMADTRGKVVLMSFLYTHCTDLCPFIALKMKDAYQLLGADAKDVALVVVTTDPKRDTPTVDAAYSRKLGLFDVWHFVTGAPDAVHTVWADYGIGVSVDSDTQAAASAKGDTQAAAAEEEPAPTQGLSSADLDLAGAIIQAFGGGYDVAHSAPFWFVDRKGMIRLEMDANATPADIVANLRELLRQP